MLRAFRLNPRSVWLLLRRGEAQRPKYVEYKFGSPERAALDKALFEVANNSHDVPLIIGNEKIFTGDEQHLRLPMNHKRVLAKYYYSNKAQIAKAISVANQMRAEWRMFPMSERIAIWNRTADLLETEERHLLNATIMLGQAKPYKDAETDTTRLIFAIRQHCDFMHEFLQIKPKWKSPPRVFPSLNQRPLDGFVASIGPFNQTCVAATMAMTPALCGNCVIWKPSRHCCLACYLIYKTLMKAGLPRGVISFMTSNSRLFMEAVTQSPDLAGVTFTGKSATFSDVVHQTWLNIRKYRSWPRLVGECGGKNFHFVHASADMDLVAHETVKAAFVYSGQLCNCCSRLYVPKSKWPELCCRMQKLIDQLKVGDPCDYTTNISAVISEQSFDYIVDYLHYAAKSDKVDVVYGGDFCKTLGYYIEPTVVVCHDPTDKLLMDELLGPVLAVHLYDEKKLCETLAMISALSRYAYTGAIFASEDKAICSAVQMLRMTASNMYINGRCTGRRDGELPIGGNRWSGTNDKTNSMMHLTRWSQPQRIEEHFPRRSEKVVGKSQHGDKGCTA